MSLRELPEGLPVPIDDGAAGGLLGRNIPDLSLPATHGGPVKLRQPGWAVFYIYPLTGRPDVPLPTGWDEIPGARGCTPQSCDFRDRHSEFQQLNTQVFGLSTQTTAYQLEAVERLHLPFELLSDTQLLLKHELGLPTFVVAGMALYKRMTLIVRNGEICKVFYPAFPPQENAREVLAWLQLQDS